MFVTFSSEAYENITYFHSIAKQLIILMEHSGAIPGAIKAADLPLALNNLKHGLPHQASLSTAYEDDESEISLAKRAVPLIHLLEASIKKNCDVVWNEDKGSGYN